MGGAALGGAACGAPNGMGYQWHPRPGFSIGAMGSPPQSLGHVYALEFSPTGSGTSKTLWGASPWTRTDCP